MLATISPARKATRIPPIAAVREGATLPQSRFASHPVTAAVVLGIAVVSLAAGLFAGLSTGGALILTGVGCIALFVGVALVSRRLVRPLAALLGAPGERFGGAPGSLARENSTRDPARTARTAGALVIGLALVTLVATLGAGLKSTDRNALDDQVRADYVVTSDNGYDPFTSSASEAVADVPGRGGLLQRAQRQGVVVRLGRERHGHRARRRSARSTTTAGTRARTTFCSRSASTARSCATRSRTITT